MSDIEAVITRGRIFERLRGSEGVNVLVVGTPGTELATFINSTEMSVTGGRPALESWAGGEPSDAALCLSKMFPQIEGLSDKVACVGLSLQDVEEEAISAYISLVLQGRVPVGQPIAEMSEAELEERFPDVHTGMKIDMVVFVCPGNDPVPVKVMEAVKTGVDSTYRNIPLFLCMTKQNSGAPSDSTKENKQKAQNALGISEEECDFIQLYHKSRTGSKVGQKDAIDKPLLKFWDKILNVSISSGQAKLWDLKHNLQWGHLAAICNGVSLIHFALLFCMVINIVVSLNVRSAVQEIEVRPFDGNCTMHMLDRKLAEDLQEALLTNFELLHTLNSSLKHEMQNMTSELLNTLNSNFNKKLQEMKSEIQKVTFESLNTLNSTFDGMLQEIRSEIQNMASELLNTFNSNFHERLHELKSKVVDILSSELANHTSNLTNDLNRALNNFEGQMNSALKDANTRFDNRSVAFSKKMSEDTEILDHKFSTLTKTLDEISPELNKTWERGLLSLRNETERIVLNVGTEVDKKQATFYGKLGYRFRKWVGEHKKANSVMNTTLQCWQGKFNETNSKLAQNLESTVATLNASDGETIKDQKEQIPQESVMARIMMQCKQYSLEILVAVVICGIIWLACSPYKKGSYQGRQQIRGRVVQAPQYDDMSDNEEWPDENHQVCIIASQDWTLDEVEGCVKTAVANPNILTLRISGQDDIDVLKRTLQRETRVICCANSTTRNILLSDTEHDEISYVVKAAEKIVGESGVMVLLYGHEKSRDIQQMYDDASFDRTFLNKQTRLLHKAHQGNFFSVFKSLNEIQKRRLCDWIRA